MGGEPDSGGAAVLAVDDYARNLVALSVILEPLHVNLVAATSGREALQRAKERSYSVVLLDMVMPDVDGFETLRWLRSTPLCRETPVVLLTAHELDPNSLEQLEGMGMVDYILKPIAPIILRSKVAAFVSLEQRGAALAGRDAMLAAKDQHIAMLAHDLRNPLAAVSIASEVLRHMELDGRAVRQAELVARGVARMHEMVENLTEVARAGRAGIPVTPRPMDLGALANDLLTELPEVDAARVRLSTVGNLAGVWDYHRLAQVLANLIGNALRHGEGAVALRIEAAGPEVEISIHNRGEPIPPDILPLVFQPFERERNDRRGLGLGLYIVHEIARAHGGTVSVTSSDELGTTFAVCLPRDHLSGDEMGPPSDAAPTA